jgi:hypothetical protein
MVRGTLVIIREKKEKPGPSTGLRRKSLYGMLSCLCVAQILDSYMPGNKDK